VSEKGGRGMKGNGARRRETEEGGGEGSRDCRHLTFASSFWLNQMTGCGVGVSGSGIPVSRRKSLLHNTMVEKQEK